MTTGGWDLACFKGVYSHSHLRPSKSPRLFRVGDFSWHLGHSYRVFRILYSGDDRLLDASCTALYLSFNRGGSTRSGRVTNRVLNNSIQSRWPLGIVLIDSKRGKG